MISQEGETAMNACADKAEAETSFSVDECIPIVLAKLAEGATTGEVLTWTCKDAGIVPHDDRAFGAVLAKLSRKGLIVKIGSGPRHRGHGTAGATVWSLA